MNRSENYLLYVLSQQLVPVPKGTSSRWNTGDVILVDEASARSTDRYLILAVSQERQTLALCLSDNPKCEVASKDYVSLGPDGLGLSEPDFALGKISDQPC